MYTSPKLSFLLIRLGLAAVFLWFGIDKFIHPSYWLNAWVPEVVVRFFNQVGISGGQFVYLNGIFETLVGISLVLGIFIKFFSVLAIGLLLAILGFSGITEITVRDLGLIGGLLALVFWPTNRDRF